MLRVGVLTSNIILDKTTVTCSISSKFYIVLSKYLVNKNLSLRRSESACVHVATSGNTKNSCWKWPV